ncbi:hypothetical protein [Streptomyces erythrochromogenes]
MNYFGTFQHIEKLPTLVDAAGSRCCHDEVIVYSDWLIAEY